MTIGQGFDMGRPSILLTRVRKEGGKVVSAHVGGACVFMMEGTLSDLTFVIASEAKQSIASALWHYGLLRSSQ